MRKRPVSSTILKLALLAFFAAAVLLPLLRMLAAESGGNDGFLRSALALRVFRERGLVQITEGPDGFLTLRLSHPAGKVDLFACPYLQRLKDPNGRE